MHSKIQTKAKETSNQEIKVQQIWQRANFSLTRKGKKVCVSQSQLEDDEECRKTEHNHTVYKK